nr:immunoglobulin light chain junction region [Macaca mulatta]MOY00433.1 immunoglobulin light chain junction region [Macaca mulatta]MOY01245.1 immunoglobulin light chain junction region [Macaca mulatta]MOY02534.1 immunoglobulin light chain junction region [Macaca mulatta]
CQQYNRDPFTF